MSASGQALRVKRAIEAIDEVFSDMSCTPDETLDAMREIADHVDTKIDALEEDAE